MSSLVGFPEGASSAPQGSADKDADDVTTTTTTTTRPPSHILQDGTFVHLPPPSHDERIRFFERSIARHGLLQEDLQQQKTDATKEKEGKAAAEEEAKQEEQDDEDTTKSAATTAQQQTIHPLALASARLQASGINELNRAINLHTLVSTGEYFGLSNIVDPALEQAAAASSSSNAATN